jgi:A/G-specific adenine glycosylase
MATKTEKTHEKEKHASVAGHYVRPREFVGQLSPVIPLVVDRTGFQTALANWYRSNARVLPWRQSPSVYKTVVSEFMLQQTQVKTVLPYFARWLEAFPDFAALAAASEERVLRLWEGLGYYSRARNLHRLAKIVASKPAMPQTPDAWRELPGVGPYTAAAITSISFNEPAACVDGNVVRILSRLTADATPFRDSASAAKLFALLAQSLMPERRPGQHNQAMMELGATVCHRQKPLCLTCPVRTFCRAAQEGEPEAYPRLAPKLIERQRVTRLWCRRGDHLLLHRASVAARRLAGQHELPSAEHLNLTSHAFPATSLIATRRRSITRFQIQESIYVFELPKKKLPAGLVWVPVSSLDDLTLSGPHRRWIGEILAGHG